MYPPAKIPAGFEWLRFNPLLQIVDLARHAAVNAHVQRRLAFHLRGVNSANW